MIYLFLCSQHLYENKVKAHQGIGGGSEKQCDAEGYNKKARFNARIILMDFLAETSAILFTTLPTMLYGIY